VRGRFHFDDPSTHAEAVAEHDRELGYGGGPLALGTLPIVAHAPQDQIQQFDRRLISREVSAAANGDAQGTVKTCKNSAPARVATFEPTQTPMPEIEIPKAM
jgi:hypothetical protein